MPEGANPDVRTDCETVEEAVAGTAPSARVPIINDVANIIRLRFITKALSNLFDR